MLKTHRPPVGKTLTCLLLCGAFALPASADGRWGFSIGPYGAGFSYTDRKRDIYIDTTPRYVSPPVVVQPPSYRPGVGYYPYPNYQYYPYYNPNPVIRRDVTERGYYDADGTFHSDTTVEDRRASYYSPGRNQAITPPRTTVTHSYGPDGVWRTQEHTSWIGADGRPHSTTIDKTTSQDIWGNTHTDTHVTLKKKSGAGASEGEAANSEAANDPKPVNPDAKGPAPAEKKP